MNKTYYYHFNKFDTTFWAMMIVFITAMGCSWCYRYCCCYCLYIWGIFGLMALLWCYKHIKHKAVVITDESIKIDHCNPLAWKDITSAEVKTVRMGRKDYKILSLEPKENIEYRYNWLQKHNCQFGAFAIPLYGILTPEDEAEIEKIVKGKVK